MPVNTDTSFIYWEVTDKLLNGNRRKLKSGSARLTIKVSEADCMKEVCSFEVKERIGKNYINYQPSFKPLIAEIGIMNGRGFVGLLQSRTVYSPSYRPSAAKKTLSLNPGAAKRKNALKNENPSTDSSATTKETWMTKTEDTCEIISVPSSKIVAKVEEIRKYYQKTMGQYKDIFSAEFQNFF
jgi:hypothetical protein